MKQQRERKREREREYNCTELCSRCDVDINMVVETKVFECVWRDAFVLFALRAQQKIISCKIAV